MKRIQIVLAAASLVVFAAGSAMAASNTASTTITANVAKSATLSISNPTIDLSLADTTTAATGSLTVTAKARIGALETATLTVASSSGSGFAGAATNPLNAITVTTSDAGFAGHIVSATSEPLASWTNSGQHSGTYSYNLANSWDYMAGNYSATVTYTLATP
jgi:hypothetical protein